VPHSPTDPGAPQLHSGETCSKASAEVRPGVHPTARAVAWTVTAGLTGYDDALAFMEARAAAIAAGLAPELIWLVEHPSLYTAGTSANPNDILNPANLPVHWTGRGGQVTYHGPGQRVVYVMLDVQRRFGGDMGAFIRTLEDWIIATLAAFDVAGSRVSGRTGVWVEQPAPRETGARQAAKIAAIGLRVRRGISFHGIALNVSPDLVHFAGIVPCGITDAPVTSIAATGRDIVMKDVDIALEESFRRLFSAPVEPESAPFALPASL
jgi:lipoyl(octanoyl) transferase